MLLFYGAVRLANGFAIYAGLNFPLPRPASFRLPEISFRTPFFRKFAPERSPIKKATFKVAFLIGGR